MSGSGSEYKALQDATLADSFVGRTYLSNRSPALIADPDKFDAKRWIGTGKSATTAGQDYLAFGLGRWSYQGLDFALVRQADFELQGGHIQ
ncbi:hypothetical protein EV126DRAFT_435327, partial [Verticillium dahliae]